MKRVPAAKARRRPISVARFQRCQPVLECLLDLFGIGVGQSVFGAQNPMRPSGGLLGRANVGEFGRKLVAQSGRGLGAKPWHGEGVT